MEHWSKTDCVSEWATLGWCRGGWVGVDLYNIWCKQALYVSWKQMHTNLMPTLPPSLLVSYTFPHSPYPPPSLSRSRPTYKAADGNELNGRERRAFVLGRVGVVARPALVCLWGQHARPALVRLWVRRVGRTPRSRRGRRECCWTFRRSRNGDRVLFFLFCSPPSFVGFLIRWSSDADESLIRWSVDEQSFTKSVYDDWT